MSDEKRTLKSKPKKTEVNETVSNIEPVKVKSYLLLLMPSTTSNRPPLKLVFESKESAEKLLKDMGLNGVLGGYSGNVYEVDGGVL